MERIDKLYGRLLRCSFELYKFRKDDVEYISVCGVVTCKDEKTSQDLEEKHKDIELGIAALKRSVDEIVASRTKLVTVFIRISANLELAPTSNKRPS